MNEITTMPSRAIPIALAFTSNYVVPAAVTITSVLKNADSEDVFHFICLMTEELSNQTKINIQQLASKNTYFSFINMTGRLENTYVDEKYTIAASYRLLLADLLPEYNKVVYMDCDIIIRNNVAKLFHETNLDKHYMAGVFEATLPFQQDHMDAIGCRAGNYINSGFLVMNLAAMRKDNIVEKFISGLKTDFLLFPDQDVINQVCKDRIIGLPPFWNSIRTFLLPQYKHYFLNYYSVEDWAKVQSVGNIHYTGPKPWNAFTVGFGLWWKYYYHLSRELRDNYPINKKTHLIYLLYKNPLGKAFISSTQFLYRKIKGDE